MLESSFTKMITALKRELEALTAQKWAATINHDKAKGSQKNDFYFLYNDTLNIEIVLSWGTLNNFITHDILSAAIQKPMYKGICLDARILSIEKNVTEWIINEVKQLEVIKPFINNNLTNKVDSILQHYITRWRRKHKYNLPIEGYWSIRAICNDTNDMKTALKLINNELFKRRF